MDEKITVTVSADTVTVAERLRAAGMNVEQVLDAAGVITGSVATADRSSLAALPGVEAVESERTFQIAPPDAEIQ